LISMGAGYIALSAGVYLVKVHEALPTLLFLQSRKERVKHHVRLLLVPCGTRTFGELPEATAKALGEFGLQHLDTSVPAKLQQG
jgi:hypothetical protein